MNVKEAVCRLVELHHGQEKVAELLRTTQQTVSRWSKGKAPPAAEMTLRIFDLLERAEGDTTDGGDAAA